MVVYQLVAKGIYKNLQTPTPSFYSQKVFSSRELAKDYIPNFKKICCQQEGTYELFDIDEGSVKVEIIPLSVDEFD